MIKSMQLTPPGARLMRDAMSMYADGGLLSFEAGRDALQHIRRGIAEHAGREPKLENTPAVRDAAIGVMRTVELYGDEAFVRRLGRLRSVVATFGERVVDREDAEEIVAGLAQPMQRWRRSLTFRRTGLKNLAREKYAPLAEMIADKADLLTIGAAGAFAVRLAHDLDIIDHVAACKGGDRLHALIMGAAHTVFGMNCINRSLITIDDALFGGDGSLTAQALLPGDSFAMSALVSINYRMEGLFLKSVHGLETLKLLGAAEELKERATAHEDPAYADRMIAMLRQRGVFDDDPVAELGRLELIADGIKLVAEPDSVEPSGPALDVHRRITELHDRLIERSINAGAVPY